MGAVEETFPINTVEMKKQAVLQSLLHIEY